MNIALDMMGGDFAPLEAVKGAAEFLADNNNSDIHLTLIGDAAQINEHFDISTLYILREIFTNDN